MARKSITKRREEQRKRQANLRTDAKEKRRPGRDDVARMLLWLMIKETTEQARRRAVSGPVDKLAAVLIENLVAQGFDADEASAVFEDLLVRYSSRIMPFRIKRHLNTSA